MAVNGNPDYATQKGAVVRLRVAVVVNAAAIVAAVVLCIGLVVRQVDRAAVVGDLVALSGEGTGFGGVLNYQKAEARIVARWGLSDRDRVIVFGDRSRATRTDQQKALWDLDPTNRVFYAHYLRYRMMEVRNDLTPLEEDVRLGEQLDPDNAYYNYCLAGALAEKAGKWTTDTSGPTNRQAFVVLDTNLLDRAMAEFRRGAGKPRFTSYAADLLALRRSLLPPSEDMGDALIKIGMTAGVVLPHIAPYRSLARASKEYGARLLAEGRPADAAKVLTLPAHLAEGMMRDSWCLIEVLVAGAIAGIARDQAAPVLEAAGLADEAAALRERADAVAAPVTSWKNRIKKNGMNEKWRGKASVLVGMLLPALGDEVVVTDAELAPSRTVEQLLMEQSAVALLILLLLAFLLIMGVMALWWRKAEGTSAAPFLLLPDWRQAVRIMGLTIAIPIAAYIVYTRFSGLAGRDVALTANLFRVVSEVVVLGLAMWIGVVLLSFRHVRQRCRGLGIAVPPTWKEELGGSFSLKRTEYALYYGTAARSVMPALAVAILLLGGVVMPWLAREEARLVRSDPLLAQSDRAVGFTVVESRLVNRLRDEAIANLKRLRVE
jgi:hypothetical protein